MMAKIVKGTSFSGVVKYRKGEPFFGANIME